MYSSYIHKEDGNFIAYYTKNNILYKRELLSHKWQNEQIIATSVKPLFTLNSDIKNGVHIFIKSINDELLLIYSKDNKEYNTRKMLDKNSFPKSEFFMSFQSNETLTLVYAEETEHNRFDLNKICFDGKAWSEKITIDTFYNNSSTVFTSQKISDNHFLLCYEDHERVNSVKFLEISSKKHSTPYEMITSQNAILESSYLVTDKNLHVVSLVKNASQTQIIYHSKTNKDEKPTLLIEGLKLRNLSLFKYDDRLYLTFTKNEDVYYTYSNNETNISFCKPQKLSTTTPYSPLKKCSIVENTLSYNQLFVSVDQTFFPVFINDINPYFLG